MNIAGFWAGRGLFAIVSAASSTAVRSIIFLPGRIYGFSMRTLCEKAGGDGIRRTIFR